MVVFTCNHCGDSLQKPKVEKHYQATACRNGGVNVSCMDCHKDFRGEEYIPHTSCISELERYSAKGFVPKPNQNKGEKKQMAWVETVRSILNNNENLKVGERNLLNILCQQNNVPRKKVKFINFVKSSYQNRVKDEDIEGIWGHLEEAQKKEQLEKQKAMEVSDQNGAITENGKTKKEKKLKSEGTEKTNGVSNGESIEIGDTNMTKKELRKLKSKGTDSLTDTSKENVEFAANNEVKEDGSTNEIKLSKKELKEKRKREKYEAQLKAIENEPTQPPETELVDDQPKKKKKSKKHDAEAAETVSSTNSEINPKKRPAEDIVTAPHHPALKISKPELVEVQNSKNGKFDWNEVIIATLKSKDNELTVKRLRKKVLAEYLAYSGLEECNEQIMAKYNKKIHKIKGVRVDKDKVKLIEATDE